MKLKSEVDLFWSKYENNFNYQNIKTLNYLTKCIQESLRLWPAVTNGSFRILGTSEEISGLNGKKIKLPKGTYCQLTNWSKHRNIDLWGEDANKFNPDRKWKGDEIYNNGILSGYNPNSDRFTPFSYTPRDCLGKNFAQMEMRVILIYLIRYFDFTFPDDINQLDEYNGINRATLGPLNILKKNDFLKKDRKMLPPLELGCWFDIKKRHNVLSKL
jgi:benzoate 4-monooxygenase